MSLFSMLCCATTFLVTMSLFGALPIAVMWYIMNLEGHTQKALGTAFMIAFGNIGSIVAAFSFEARDAPEYHGGIRSSRLGFRCVLHALSRTAAGCSSSCGKWAVVAAEGSFSSQPL